MFESLSPSNQPVHPHQPPVRSPGARAPEHVDMAKWPPDDDDAPAGGGAGGAGAPAGGGGPIGPYDADFKKGRFNPKLVLLAALLIIGGVLVFVFAIKREAARLPADVIAQMKKNAYVLPKAERLAQWRDWASKSEEWKLMEEGLIQLGLEDDKSVIPLAMKDLEPNDHRIRGVAAQVLAHFATPDADAAKDPLQRILLEADDSDRPQITWALVTLKDSRVFDGAMKLYRAGHLTKVQRLGGGPAFNPEMIAALVSLDRLATMASDESESVRQLIANILSRNAEPKWTDTLIKLVRDESADVGREAATGLGKIADQRARGPLIEALAKADKDNRAKFLEALRDGIGGEGLVIALSGVQKSTFETQWHQTKQLFDLLKQIEDPRIGPSLTKYLDTKPHLHWLTEGAFRLAEVGELRAVPILADRLLLDAAKAYTGTSDYERMLKRDEAEHERIVAARMLADLVVLHPEAGDDVWKAADDSVIHWMHDMPMPHANALRYMANRKSQKDIDAMRKWANPTIALPLEGQQPPLPDAWAIAQSALRYIGKLKDPNSWGVLEKGFKRRDPKIDVTEDSMMGGGLAMLGMTLRALNVGASDGFAEWGDPKAFPLMTKFIEDPMENEQGRFEACFALPWVATDKDMQEIAKRVRENNAPEPKKQWVRGCYLEALIHRPTPNLAPALVDMLVPNTEIGVRHQVARVIGRAGFDEKVQDQLFKKLDDPEVRNDAALALILGGTIDVAQRAVARYSDYPSEAIDALKETYYFTFGYWSDEDVASGRLYKWVETAQAIGRVRVKDTLQDWARMRLQAQFDNLTFDNGPHSMTRVVLRSRLLEAAKKGTPEVKKGAVNTLLFMKEQGCLMALREEQGETGVLAKKAFFELMNPKMVQADNIPTSKAPAGGGVNVIPAAAPK
jgi:HEAT repeat protein